MSKTRRCAIIISILLLVVAVLLIAFRVYSVNSKVIKITTEHYQMGEWVDLGGTILSNRESENPEGYSVRVNSVDVISYDDYIQKHGLNKEKAVANLDEKSVIDLELEIRNIGNDAGALPLMNMILIPARNNTYFIWNDKLWAENEPNSKDSIVLATRKDSEYVTHIPYTRNIFDDDFTAFKKPIDDKEFSLVLSNMPTRKVIDIKVLN